jgi:hypothetical protein
MRANVPGMQPDAARRGVQVRCACTERGKQLLADFEISKRAGAARRHTQKTRLKAAGDEMGEK